MVFGTLIWDPDRNIFVIPYLNHPITWYGFLFATGFIVGFFFIRKMFADLIDKTAKTKEQIQLEAMRLTDRLAILLVTFSVLGARLGHVFFYDWAFYKSHPLSIFKVWEGGLASHGGAIGVLLSIFLFVLISRKSAPQMTFLTVLDAIMVPGAFLAGCIRVGNFINQEITGIPTSLPWGVIFKHPLDGVANVPLHPAQLYEAIVYFLLFIGLTVSWRRNKKILGKGLLSGWFFLIVFGSRFFLEYLKAPQNQLFDTTRFLSMGQLLSIPFILLGILLILRRVCYVRKNA